MSSKIKSWAELTGSDTNCPLLKTGEVSHLHLCKYVKIFRRACCSWTGASSQTAAFCLQRSAVFILHKALKSTFTPSSVEAWIIRRKHHWVKQQRVTEISRCFPGGRSRSRGRRLELFPRSCVSHFIILPVELQERLSSTKTTAGQTAQVTDMHICKLQSEGGNTHYFISV